MVETSRATLTTNTATGVLTTRDQVYTGVATWIEDFYNRRRVHGSLGGKSPHRSRTTPSGPDNSPINKPPAICTQAQAALNCRPVRTALEFC